MDNQSLEQLVKEDIAINQENNKILKKLWSGVKWGRIFRVFYLVIIVGSALGLYYFLQPYIDSFRGFFDMLNHMLQNPRDAVSNILSNGSTSVNP